MGGIAVAGTILVDNIYETNVYPKAGELVKISTVQRAVGGCVPNVAIDLKSLSPSLPVYAVGKIGDDEEGRFVSTAMAQTGVDTSGVKTADERTSFTAVISCVGGQRTFFTYGGANDFFEYGDVDFDSLCDKNGIDHLHLGYFLLLDKIDGGDGEKILAEAKRRGIRTSIDLVSDASNGYEKIIPALKYVDDIIINETEAGGLTKMQPKAENLRAVAEKIMSYGVRERVVIHMPEAGVVLSKSGFIAVPSYELPASYIKGSTGAGDAFCAGALIAINRGGDDREILELGSMAAVASLGAADSVSGMKTEEEIKIILKNKNFRRKELCW